MAATNLDVAALVARTFVGRVDYHPTLTSTNDEARRIAAQTPPDLPVLVIADRQTAGRGRGTNRWWTGAGSLACSLLFDAAGRGIERRYYPMIPLAGAVAIVETVAPLVAPHEAGLHWPNDVFAAGRKLAGVLVESASDGRQIVGIGLNLNNSAATAPRELAGIVTTLADLAGKIHDRTTILLRLLARLDPALDELASAPEQLGRRGDRLCLQRGRRLSIQSGSRQLTGICAGIAADGAIVLDTPSGREALYSGVVIQAKPGE